MSLIAWWPLNGDINNYGTLGAELQATASNTTFVNGKIGQALYKGSLTLTSEQWKKIIDNTISIAMWIYTRDDGTYSAGTPFFGNSGMTKPNNRKFTMFHYPAKTTLHCSWQNDDLDSADRPNTYFGTTYANFFEIGKWVHLCVVQDAATETVTVYRNGTQYSTTKVSGLATMNFKSAAAAPIRNNIDYQHINDLRIYDHALSQAEVKEISKALVMHYTFDDICAEPTTNLLPVSLQNKYVENAADAASYTVTSGLTASAYTLSANIKRHIGDQSPSPYVSLFVTYSDGTSESITTSTAVDGYNIRGTADGEFHPYKITVFNTSKKTVTKVNGWILDRGSYTSGTPRYMTIQNAQLEAKDHATPYTPTSREGMLRNEVETIQPSTISNIVLSVDSASGSYSLKCAGSTYLNHNPLGDGSNATASFWLKNFNTSGQMVVFADANSKLAFGPYGSYNCISCQSGVTSQVLTSELNKYWKTTDWNHVVVRKNSSNEYSCFINGTKVVNTTGDYWTHDNYLSIGCRISGGSAGRQMTGSLDDFRLYYTYLSDTDIQDLYKAKAYITDKGDIETHQFVESKTQAQVTSKYCFEADEFYEELYNGYDVLEYIESTGTQYVDTGYVTTLTDYTYELDMSPTKIGGFYSYMGFMASGNTPRAGIHEYSNVFMLGANATTNSTTTPVVNERVVLKGHFKSGAQKLYKNGILIASNSTSFNHSANTLSTHIFGRNYSNGRNLTSIKLYSAKIYEGSTLVRHYIPVRRQSDNALGLYDILTDTFCANSGSGTFVSGPAITNKSASIYEDMHVSGREIIEI